MSRCLLHSNHIHTTLIMLLHTVDQIILQTPTFMHHLGSTLSFMCSMKRDYKGKSELNISRWQKHSAQKKVIFLLKNNYSSWKPFVSVRFVVLTKWGVPFITMNGGRHWTALYFSIFSHSHCFRTFGLETVVICGFMIYGSLGLENKQTCTACVNISLLKKLALCNSSLS